MENINKMRQSVLAVHHSVQDKIKEITDDLNPNGTRVRRQSSVSLTLEGIEYCVQLNQPNHEVNLEKPSNKYVTSKYTVWNFLPKNLFEQFLRVANFYFLLIVILMLIPGVAPISPITTILPLVAILSVSAIRSAVEDHARHVEDDKINNQELERVDPEDGDLQKVKSQELRVGDLIVIKEGEEFPADLVLLSSSKEIGTAFIDTANLDGETSLKLRSCVGKKDWNVTKPEVLAGFRGMIYCEQPNAEIESFKGNFDTGWGDKITMSQEQLLLRGSILRNTEWIVGAVVYVGIDTKLSLNLEGQKFKMTRVEILLNRCVMTIFVIQTIVCCTWSGIARSMDRIFNQDPYNMHLDEKYADLNWAYVYDVFTWFILCSYLIPMNLYVLCEFAKYSCKFFIEWDEDMIDKRDPDVQYGARVNVSTVVEELGQIQYILSDKTGTLTENIMCLTGMSASGIMLDVHPGTGQLLTSKHMRRRSREGIYDETPRGSRISRTSKTVLPVIPPSSSVSTNDNDDDDNYNNNNDDDESKNDKDTAEKGKPRSRTSVMRESQEVFAREKDLILLAMAVCSTVTTNKDTGAFAGESPDEVALAKAAKENGFNLKTRGIDTCILDAAGSHPEWVGEFEVLAQLEFTSSRRRMDTLIRCPNDGKILLFCKGADSVMFTRTDVTSGELEGESDRLNRHGRDLNALRNHLSWFSQQGLRTLVFSYYEVDEKMAKTWMEKWHDAKAAVYNRARKEEEAFEELERLADIIGCTAVEDRLQEGVKETLVALRDAGIQIAMLTGDKQETAINIGYNTGLMRLNHTLLNVVNFSKTSNPHAQTTQTRQDLLRNLLDKIDRTCGGRSSADIEPALVIDGASTQVCLSNPMEKELLCELMAKCKTAICNRMTPKQKAAMVRLLKEDFKRVSLAVGDGANDVSMIREANVGVGIRGKEGLQAVNSADFALSQFKHLRKLLLVHGRYAYLRVTRTMAAAFFANLAFNVPIVLYGFYSGFSGQAIFSEFNMAWYNLLFTLLIQVHFVFFERDCDTKTILSSPQAYIRLSANGGMFNAGTFVKIFLTSLWHGGLCFWVSVYGLTYHAHQDTGLDLTSLGQFQIIWATSVVFGSLTHMIMQYQFFTKYGAILIALDFTFYIGANWFYQGYLYSDDFLQDNVSLLSLIQPGTILCIFFVVVTSLLPVFTVQQFSRWINTKPYHVLEEINALGLEIVKPDHGNSMLDFADGNVATPAVGTDQMTMLASTVKMIEPKAKKKLELETIVSERDISLEKEEEK